VFTDLAFVQREGDRQSCRSGSGSSDDSNIFSYLESQRAYLENRVGVERLIRVYKLVSR
jgi:hypothetical protein